jgi:hypothetical protein
LGCRQQAGRRLVVAFGPVPVRAVHHDRVEALIAQPLEGACDDALLDRRGIKRLFGIAPTRL